MKKLQKIFSLLLCSMLFLFPTACKSQSDETKNAEKDSEYIQIESFDSYTTVTKIYCDGSIGDGCISKDYASEGEGSFKVQVATKTEANKDKKRSTFFYVPLRRDAGNYIDFSMVDQLSLDVYGLEGTDLSVSISLVLRGKQVVSGPVESFEVKNGEWSTVYFNVNRMVTNALLDITKISDVRISCAGVNAVICVDNLQLHKTTLGYSEVEITLDKDEFCDFEKSYQSFMAITRENSGFMPTAEIVTDPNWATSGARSLKVVSPDTLGNNPYFYLIFSKKLCSASGFVNYPDTAYFVFDIYKPFNNAWSIQLQFVNTENAKAKNKIKVPQGIGWYTICVPLTNRVTKTTQLQLEWQGAKGGLENGGAGGVTFYVDNMRFLSEVPNTDTTVLPTVS